MADRFTYLPLTGVFLLLAWTAHRLGARRARLVPVLASVGALVLLACSFQTRIQVGYWRDTVTLFERSLEVESGAAALHINLGNALQAEGRATHPDSAVRDATEAVRLAESAAALGGNRSPRALDILAAAYASAGRFDRAVATAQRALRLIESGSGSRNADPVRRRLALYLSHRPYRTAARPRLQDSPAR